MPKVPDFEFRELQVMKVIRVETCEGKGTNDVPYRSIQRYFDMDGDLLFRTLFKGV